jgi:acyl dehydratase
MSEVTAESLKARIGEVLGHSRWIMIDQPMIDAFGRVTLDEQFIHTDPIRAKESMFGGTIAHGFLTLSLLSAMSFEVIPKLRRATTGVNRGFDKVRLLSPVPVNSWVRGVFGLVDMVQSDRDIRLTCDVTIEIQGQDKPALAAQWLFMYLAETKES